MDLREKWNNPLKDVSTRHRPLEWCGLPSRWETKDVGDHYESWWDVIQSVIQNDLATMGGISGIGQATVDKVKRRAKQWAKAQSKETNHVVLYSGGVGSWYTTVRLVEDWNVSRDNIELLFTDTNMEHPDLYRFLDETADDLGMDVTKIEDGRTPWQVFKDVGFLGNSRVDPCSRILKRELADDYIEEKYNPFNVRVHIGIDWTEDHRFERLWPRKMPYVYDAPLCSEPYVQKQEMFIELSERGIEIPELYQLEFPHNNCGGFCVKAGLGHFRHLYHELPDTYEWAENKEQEVIEYLREEGKIDDDQKTSILTKTEDGEEFQITLKELREQYITNDDESLPEYDFGGCACMLDVEEDE